MARETGWSRDFILWELGLPEVLQYNHCALRAMGVWTVKPEGDARSDQLKRMEAFVKAGIDEALEEDA